MTNLVPSSESREGDAGSAARVYVGNLKPKANEIHITEAFARFGAIQSVWVARKPPGFAFVAFEHESDALRAVRAYDDAHPLEILGKRVKVQLAGEKSTTKETTASKTPSHTARKRGTPGDAIQLATQTATQSQPFVHSQSKQLSPSKSGA